MDKYILFENNNFDKIINSFIDTMCKLDEELYYNIDEDLIYSISNSLMVLRLFRDNNYIYNCIINRLNSRTNWDKHKLIIKNRKKCYNMINYIIKKKKYK